MIEKIIDDIVDEISLEGQEGCAFDQLFTFAESIMAKSIKEADLPRPICYDDNYKAYLWLHLRNLDQLLFIMNGTQLDPSTLSYKELKEISLNNALRVKTAEHCQDQSIYGSLRSLKKSLTDKHQLVLTEIAKSRSQGISQFQLGEKLNMETKTVFYYTKKLDSLGLIVKEAAYAEHMNTRIIFLRRFAKQDDEPQEDTDGDLYRIGTFKNNLIKQLSSAPNNIMTLQEVISAMGFVTHRNIRWARVKISQLHDQGVVEKINAFNGKTTKSSVRLCNGPTEPDTAQEEEDNSPADEPMNEVPRQESFYRDLPGEYQFYRDIVQTGERGLVRQELVAKYPEIDPQLFKTFFESAILAPKSEELQKYAVYRSEELDGKSKLFRYFGCEGWKIFSERIGKTMDEPRPASRTKDPVLVEPTAFNEIGKSFGLLPSTKIPISRVKAKMEKEKAQSKKTSEKSTAKRKRPNSSSNTLEEGQSIIEPANIESARTTRLKKARRTISESIRLASMNISQIDFSIMDEDDEEPSSSANSQVAAEDAPQFIGAAKPKKSKKTSTLNSTKVRRINILLQMMEEKHIRELNTDTANEFNEIEKKAAGGQKMAVSTFNKMAKQLHEEKKLKLYVTSINKQFGLNEIKTFLLHPSVSEDGEEMKKVLDTYQMERPIMSRNSKRKELRSVNVEVLPSSEVLRTMGQRKTERTPMESTSLASEYGWIKSKWHRSKALHESLMEYYNFSGKDDYIIDVLQYIKFMSLDTLITIVSNLPYEDNDFRAFVDNEENRATSLGDVPENIRLLVFQSRLRIRFLINHFLQVLEALDVVKALDKADTAIAPRYLLSNQGVIRDYAFKDRAIVKTLPLENVDDVRNFWEQLQIASLYPVRPRSKTDEEELEKSIDENDPLYNIHRSRGWVVEVILTDKQKEILDSHIDTNAPSIPSDNPALRVHLMKTTKLTAKRIRAYYTGLLSSIQKKQAKEEQLKARLQKQLALSADSTINDLMLASREKRKIASAIDDMKQQNPFVLPTYIGSRRVRRLRVRTEPFEGRDHDTRDYTSSASQNPNALEKELLVYAYCIMKVRARGGSFFWDPATTILTGKSKHRCRRIFNTMKVKDPSLIIRIEDLKKKWERIYKEGIATSSIKDENPWNTLEYDLPSFVEYFLVRLKEEEESDTMMKNKLPLEIKDLHDNYRVARSDHDVLQAKRQSNNQSLTLGIFDESNYDVSSNSLQQSTHEREVHLVKTLIKMLLMTPDDLYNSEAAYNIFKNYHQDVIEEAIKSLNDEGLVIKDKSKYGRVPGRSVNVSEKFMKVAEGVFPHGLMHEAKIHFLSIAENETVQVRQTQLNSGVAASTLSLLSQKKVSLYITQTNAFKKYKDFYHYPRASAVHLQRRFINKGLEIAIKKNVPLPSVIADTTAQVAEAKYSTPTSEQIDLFIISLEKDTPLIRPVYDAIKSGGTHGSLLEDIEKNLSMNKNMYTNVNELRDVLSKLVNYDPPLLHVVGFENLRYVAAECASPWFLKTSDINTFLNPLMWNDTSGNVIPLALEGCANAVISHILTNPGISHPNLRKKFQDFFTEHEMHTLIKYLVEAKVVTVRKVLKSPRPSRVSIFNKRRLVEVLADDILVNSDEVSHYWILEDYYLFKV